MRLLRTGREHTHAIVLNIVISKKKKKSSSFFLFSFLHFVVPIFLPWEIRVAFPKDGQRQQSRATQPEVRIKVHAGSFRVSIFHRTLTTLVIRMRA